MNIHSENHLIKQQQTINQKNQSFVDNAQNHLQTSTTKVNSVTKNDQFYHSNEFKKNYDIERYVRMLKNMVIPPETRKDIAVLVELELKSNVGISVTDLQMLLSQVEREERMENEHKNKD